MKARITASDVLRRHDFLKETPNSSEFLNESSMSNYYYKQAIKTHHKSDVLTFMKYCAEHTNTAIEYCRPCICFMEEYIDDDQIKREFYKVLNRLGKDDLKDIINIDTVPFIHETAKESLDRMKVCDRIYNNHFQVCQKVKDLNAYIAENSRPDQFDTVIWEICKSFDQFKMDNYIKLNASIEEAMFLHEMHNIPVDQNKVVDRCLDYYTLKEDYSSEDMEVFKQVIAQNPCVEYDYKEPSHCNVVCKNFKLSDNKTEEGLRNTISNFFGGTTRDICNSIDELFFILERIFQQQICSLKKCIPDKIIPFIMEKIKEKKSDPYYRNMLMAIQNSVSKTYKELQIGHRMRLKDPKYYYDIEEKQDIQKLFSALDKLDDDIQEELNFAYTNYNLKLMDQGGIFNFSESTDVLTLTEFKKFKFNNLLNTCKEIDKMLRAKAKAIGAKIKNKIFGIKERLTEEVSVYDMIDENGFIDMVVTSFIINESKTSSYHELFTELCKQLNSQYFVKEAGVTCYYLIQPDGAEIHMRQNTSVSLTEAEEEEYLHYLSPEDMVRVAECAEFLEMFSNVDPDIDLMEEAKNTFIKYPDKEYFNAFVEIASYAGIKEDIIEDLHIHIVDAHPIGESTFYFNTNHNKENYKPERDIPYNYRLEALSLMYSILEDLKESNQQKKEDTNKENTKNSKITNKVTKEERAEKAVQSVMKSINNFKLAMQGIKKGTKNLSAKEQALCRNLDAGFSMLVKSMKNALVSDRREAIIKGSVIPSFSKCIKMGIGLAALGIINPVLAIITAVGGFAASKRLTKKERALLLDDIDVELEMLEKEIQNAEARGQMKKLRALMRTKKELQRQYQRINMNIRVGKDIIPGSTTGMKQYN